MAGIDVLDQLFRSAPPLPVSDALLQRIDVALAALSEVPRTVLHPNRRVDKGPSDPLRAERTPSDARPVADLLADMVPASLAMGSALFLVSTMAPSAAGGTPSLFWLLLASLLGGLLARAFKRHDNGAPTRPA